MPGQVPGRASRAGPAGPAGPAGQGPSPLCCTLLTRRDFLIARGNSGGGKGFLVIAPKKPFAECRSSSRSRLCWERLLSSLSRLRPRLAH